MERLRSGLLVINQVPTPRRGAFLLALLSSGCGVLLVEGPPQIHRGQPVFCTENMALPKLDAALGTANAVAAVTIADQRTDLTDEERTFLFVTSAAYSTAQLVSWAIGRHKVRECRRAKLEYFQVRDSVRIVRRAGLSDHTPVFLQPEDE